MLVRTRRIGVVAPVPLVVERQEIRDCQRKAGRPLISEDAGLTFDKESRHDGPGD